MFSQPFNPPVSILFLKQPKLYLVSKVWICLCIVIQRIVLLTSYQQKEQTLLLILQIVTAFTFLAFESIALWILARRKSLKKIQLFCIFLIHLIFCQILLELTVFTFEAAERKNTEIVFQEIFFLNSVTILFTESKALQGGLLLYLISISLLRLVQWDNRLQYISWTLMFAFLLILSAIFSWQTSNTKDKTERRESVNKYLNFEKVNEGVVIFNKNNQVLVMNNMLKALIGNSNVKEALETIFKLKRVNPSIYLAQKPYLQENRIKSVIDTPTSRRGQKSFGDEVLPKSITDHPTSLEVPKSGSYLRSANVTPRPSIFQHRTSILQQGNHFVSSPPMSTRNGEGDQLRKTSDMHSNSSMLPLIKISPTKIQDNSPKPAWLGNDSESRSPLMYLMPEQSSRGESFYYGGREIKSSIRSMPYGISINDNNMQSEQISPRVEVVEKNSSESEQVSAYVKAAFENINKNQSIVITQSIEDITFPLDLIKSNANSQKNSGNANNEEKIHVIFQDNKLLEIIIYPLIYQQEEHLCICVRDVSYELKYKDLNERFEYKNRLLKFVSHEFRGPLQCSISLLYALKDFVPRELSSKYISPCLNSSKLLLNLANDILDHVQIQVGKLRINIIPCKIKKEFEEVLEMVEIQAQAQDIELELKWDPRIPRRFYTDPHRLKQIVLNLLSNSLKYTSHGAIVVEAAYRAPTICSISVADTGVGISKEGLKRLFQEFSKIQENNHLNPRGVGLGLVISKLLSLELGPDGEGLTVDSEEGKGTVFSFLLESKVDLFEDKLKYSDDYESLDENMDNLTSEIKTIHKNWQNISARKASFHDKSSYRIESNVDSNNKDRIMTLSPVVLSKQEMLTSRLSSIGTQQSRTVDNLESTRKKKSSDNLFSPQKKNIFRLQRDLSGKDTKEPFLRSYTVEGGLSRSTNAIKSDTEFISFLKKVRHTCNTPKALLVDDIKFNLTALETLLSNTFEIKSRLALNGEEAIQEVLNNEQSCAKCKNFKIIFMDIEMPTLNGFQTTQILRKKMLDGEISFIPIIGVTGHSPSENRVQCLTSGMNDLVLKPVPPKLMKELIIKWMAL